MGKLFMGEDFLLQTKTAELLYNEYAKQMPIIDYHCHLSPQQIAEDIKFENLTQAWLYGDHYKWRAMRTSGVDESYCTGGKSDYEKFEKWAATVPYTMRNPLYHWTHLELKRYFGIHEILDPGSAKSIYENASAQIQTDAFSIKNLIRRMNVKVICTTDDPIDSLEYHKMLSESDFEVKIKPAFRPDKAMEVVSAANFIAYIKKLEAITNLSVSTFNDYLFALQNRHDFFASMGCSVSDHGLEEIYVEDLNKDGKYEYIIPNEIPNSNDKPAIPYLMIVDENGNDVSKTFMDEEITKPLSYEQINWVGENWQTGFIYHTFTDIDNDGIREIFPASGVGYKKGNDTYYYKLIGGKYKLQFYHSGWLGDVHKSKGYINYIPFVDEKNGVNVFLPVEKNLLNAIFKTF
jgi:hypothetical protein